MDFSKFDDNTLVQLVAQNQDGALGELYDRFSRLVFSIALNILGEQSLAEDITQDVFLRIWEKADTFQPGRGKVFSWIASITRYRAIDVFRKRKKQPEGISKFWDMSDPPNIPDAQDVESEVVLSQRKASLRNALAKLPENQREVLTYAYFYGYTHNQIAKALNEPLGTIKTRIRLAMQKLHKMMEAVDRED